MGGEGRKEWCGVMWMRKAREGERKGIMEGDVLDVEGVRVMLEGSDHHEHPHLNIRKS